MASLLDRMAARRGGAKAWSQPPFWEIPEPLWTTSFTPGEEKIAPDFLSYSEGILKACPAVYAVIRFRAAVLSEARFQWRQIRNGQPGELFGTAELGLLEQPWPNGTTSDLLTRMEVVSSLAGSYYGTVADDQGRLGRAARGTRRVVHMRPDWTTIVIDAPSGDPNALDARVVAYVYQPPASGVAGVRRAEPVTLLPEEVVHFTPGLPDPSCRFRGMSWLTPVLDEVRADKAATAHKAKFFENGASPQMVVTLPETVSKEAFRTWVAEFKAAHSGVNNAYSTLFFAGGAAANSMGANFQQMDFKPLQGLSETRVAMAGGIHPTVLGMSEGLQGSSLNAGNFNAAKRLAAAATLRPWWRNAAASCRTLVATPSGAELWFDDRDIPFLRDDGTDLAAIRQQNAATLRSLIDGGFKPDAAVRYVATNDIAALSGNHTNLLPVQLQPPGSGEQAPDPDVSRPGASSNGTRQ